MKFRFVSISFRIVRLRIESNISIVFSHFKSAIRSRSIVNDSSNAEWINVSKTSVTICGVARKRFFVILSWQEIRKTVWSLCIVSIELICRAARIDLICRRIICVLSPPVESVSIEQGPITGNDAVRWLSRYDCNWCCSNIIDGSRCRWISLEWNPKLAARRKQFLIHLIGSVSCNRSNKWRRGCWSNFHDTRIFRFIDWRQKVLRRRSNCWRYRCKWWWRQRQWCRRRNIRLRYSSGRRTAER